MTVSLHEKNDRERRLSLGQFFTRDPEIKFMLSLIANDGNILEPSCGDGAFLRHLTGDVTAVELDDSVAPSAAIVMDFFDYEVSNKFSTIIGNPPYVANSKILPSTREKLQNFSTWSGKTNLYTVFVEKCLKHLKENGELIFIIPSIFLKATSCKNLNKEMFKTGTITHLVLYGDVSPFGSDASPEHETCIFRFEKNKFDRSTKIFNFDKKDKEIKLKHCKKYFVDDNGISFFLDSSSDLKKLKKIEDYFEVKVGAVSGWDEFFVDKERGNKEYVYSKTRKSGKTRMMIDEIKPTEWLLSSKKQLMQRKIKKEWSENDWWKWGRPQPKAKGKRVYVNTKTRIDKPFFCHKCENYDGSVLAIFPKDQEMIPEKVALMFNNVDWSVYSLKVGNRYIFKPKVLEGCHLTEEQINQCY